MRELFVPSATVRMNIIGTIESIMIVDGTRSEEELERVIACPVRALELNWQIN